MKAVVGGGFQRRVYPLTSEPLAKLSIDSGRRKNTEVSILGGA